jgi:hypothetical protein
MLNKTCWPNTFQYWNGREWGCWDETTVDLAFLQKGQFQHVEWRGLAKKP